MARFAEGKIEAYVGPPELGAADDLDLGLAVGSANFTWTDTHINLTTSSCSATPTSAANI